MSQRLRRQGRNYLEEDQHPRTRSYDRVYPSRVTVHPKGHSSFNRYVKRPWNDPDELDKSSSEDESHGAEIYSLVDELSTDDDDEVDFVSNGIFEQEAGAPLSSTPEKPFDPRIAQIVSSKYVEFKDDGSAVFAGELMQVSGRSSALFRWLHLNPDRMDFHEFRETATALPNLTRAESDDIGLFLKRVATKYEKPIRAANVHNGWCMEPTVTTKPRDQTRSLALDSVSAGYGDYLFCCLPYFRLEQHSSTVLPEGGHVHPSQPLLQSYHPSISKQRDLQQTVCHLQDIPKGYCFHVSALWCLVIADKYILTCVKDLSAEEILAESLTVKHLPAPSPPAIGTSILPPVLQVLHENRLWLLPMDQCDT